MMKWLRELPASFVLSSLRQTKGWLKVLKLKRWIIVYQCCYTFWMSEMVRQKLLLSLLQNIAPCMFGSLIPDISKCKLEYHYNRLFFVCRCLDIRCFQEVLKRLVTGTLSQRRNALDFISDIIHISLESDDALPQSMWYGTSNFESWIWTSVNFHSLIF